MNDEETLQTVTMFCCFPQLFHNAFPVLTAIQLMAYSPEDMKSTLKKTNAMIQSFSISTSPIGHFRVESPELGTTPNL